MKISNKKIALCLGGGAVLGAFHIGVLKAIEELEIDIEYITGTSIGSIVGVLYACGKSSKEIEKIALDIQWKDLYTISISKMGILSNEKIGDFLESHLDGASFEELQKKFGVVSTDIATGDKIILDSGNVKKAVMASSCIPGVFIPIEIDGKILVDGGVVENVPLSVAKKFNAEFTIAVDLNTNQTHIKPKNILEVLLNSFDILATNSTKIQTKEADILLKPDLANFDAINTSQIPKLIEEGYQYTLKKTKKRVTIMKKTFEITSTILYFFASLILVLMSLSIMWWSIYEVYHALQNFSIKKEFILTMLQSVGTVIISIAILDISKYMIEEEVLRNKELREPKEARRTLTKVMTIIAIAVSVEGLVYIFKAGTHSLELLVYPAILILTSVATIIGLGIYQKLSIDSEK